MTYPETIPGIAAEQEEHVKRNVACGRVTGTMHRYGEFYNSSIAKPYRACVNCGVTRTANDYAIREAGL